jgi:saccharopine dehydrogenase-like NADP-dependent oxidoreductase
MKFTDMKEKTLRYPGHAELMRIFRESGFFSTDTVTISGKEVKPLDVTSKLLFSRWKLQEGEEDFTVMRVIIEGRKDKKKLRYTYDLFDEYDRETETTSMARTTGYTCTIVARQVINGLFNEKGICPPEFVGRTKGCYDHLMDEYAHRNIKVQETVTELQ